MSAHIHQPSGMGELPAFECGRDALIGGSGERDKEDDGAASKQGATQGRRHDAGSLGFRLGESVLLDARNRAAHA